MKFAGQWTEPGNITLRIKNKNRKDKCSMFSLICGFSFRIFKLEYITWSNHRYQDSKEGLGMEYGALKRGSRTDRRYEGENGRR